ncbi:FAD-dependent oxidoreductase [Saccharopolyspora sp. K220]|uniref:FAD-dependent oxidoreductase n=1 Tax=Saccharopolyspora soli TaxID=2926618 RepID=UPI001F579D25|nr:FAD-dependent oxidoreductase [Saccharopolyspora soli]MCI2416123.1 FAD-dependent oxidoreductase [Saccharopolyspora soli]
MKHRVAVVGAGAAGLSAAYNVRGNAHVTLFESDAEAGGHALTVTVDDNGVERGLDMAFIVFSEFAYPRFAKFLAELGIPTTSHPGRFSFTDHDNGFVYVSDDLGLSEEEVRARYPDDFVLLWQEAERFRHTAPREFMRLRKDISLGDYLETSGYSEAFRYGFVVLLSSMVWSVSPDDIWGMPANTVLTFFFGHGFEWPGRSVEGGSANYVRRALDVMTSDGVDYRPSTPVLGVEQRDDDVVLRTAAGGEEFDYVVLATHADDSLALLRNPTQEQQRALGSISYSPTHAVLHTDPVVMPDDRDKWRSWNCARRARDVSSGALDTWSTYYLNLVQNFSSDNDYFVSVDCPLELARDSVITEVDFQHPIFTMEAKRSLAEIPKLQENSRIKFAGSYLPARSVGPDAVGGHESAFDSGFEAAMSIHRNISAEITQPR